MKVHIKQAKAEFIQQWGILATSWGISRSMGQIHAMLLLSAEPISAEDIMSELKISRGNANMTVRELQQWGLVYKSTVKGERREFFSAEKDMFKVAQIVARERKRRELDPLIAALPAIKTLEGPKADVQAFVDLTNNIRSVAAIADKAVSLFASTGVQALLKIFK